MNIPEVFRDGLAAVIAFVPLALLFLLILIVGLIVAKLISVAVEKLLERVGFDRLVERGGIKRALAGSKLDASDIVGKIIYYTLVLFVLQFAFGVFGPNPVSDLLEGIIAFLPKIIVAIIIIVLGVTAALNQIEVATTVTTPILIAVLAIIAGVIIVGAGGGLIRPMQQRWEAWLARAEQEAPRIKQEVQSAPSVGDQVQQAQRRAQRADAPAAIPARPADPTPPP